MPIKTNKKTNTAVIVFIIFITSTGYFHKPPATVQINVDDILNTRSVTTFSNNKLTSWIKGVDHGNGYLTMVAALFKNEQNPHALPDNPLLSANEFHPAILLHYSNKNAINNQTRCIQDSGEFEIKVPKHNYQGFYLCFTSAYGATFLRVEINYKDGKEIKEFTIPDWYKDIPASDTNLIYAIHNLGKWNNKNELSEKDHHNIDALNIYPNPARVLASVKIKKGTAGYLIFWAATGVLTK